MSKFSIILIALILVEISKCNVTNQATALISGEIRMPFKIYQISGIIRFEKVDHGMSVRVKISGFPKGYVSYHGLHIHQLGILISSKNITARCNSAGEHFNPFNETHGGLNTTVRHAGDFGNVVVNKHGEIRTTFIARSISFNGKENILNRTIVLHSGRDDLGMGKNSTSKINGNSGQRIACGVIKICCSK